MAHALDLTGERWTLLIVRELLAGPRRYSDLADGLVTVPTNLLASRLRQMEANGLVRRRRLPAPADSVVVYELSELGEGLGRSVEELARWGMGTLPPTREGRSFRAHWLVLALRARFEPRAAEGVTESYEFRIDGNDVVHFDVRDGEGTALMGAASEPAVVIAADADTFLALSGAGISSAQAVKRGARIEGHPDAVERLRSILPPHNSETTAPAGAVA